MARVAMLRGPLFFCGGKKEEKDLTQRKRRGEETQRAQKRKEGGISGGRGRP